MLKSRPDRYGTAAFSIQWVGAGLVLFLLGSGLQAANAMDAVTKAGFPRFHIPVAIMVLLLTAPRKPIHHGLMASDLRPGQGSAQLKWMSLSRQELEQPGHEITSLA